MASSVFFFTFFILLQISLSHSSLILPLTHSLSTTQYNTTHHLLKSTAARSANRFHHHRNHRQVSLPLTPGSDYTLSFSLGSQTISLYMDTGSDIVWIPSHPFDCILCEGKYNPISVPNPGPLNLTSATPITCKHRSCSVVHSSAPSSDLCAMAKCSLEEIETGDCKLSPCPPFYYAYGDGSFIAKLYEDTLSIPMSTPSFNLKKFTFGVAHSALGEPIGVAGFGRGPLSLPAQLARDSPDIGNYFSYCLISHSFDTTHVLRRPSPLILGHRYSGEEKSKNELTMNDDNGVVYSYTPMLENPKHPYFYSVGLEAISVGKRKIQAPNSMKRVDRKGNGGMVVDSGTTFTMLPAKFYDSVMREFDTRVGAFYKRASEVEDRTGLSPCYYGDVKEKNFRNVPQLLLHLGGNSTVVMPRRNYFYEFLENDGKVKRRVGCMMLMNGGAVADEDDSGGPAGLLGNYQQQGFEVVYDLEKKRIGFARRQCASLWDSLN
ncbi:probable aspartyl protease At4g16563 [Olea europaea var. sylvestris]|uniref:probable aspartyl protease At4g16563 n=1 Tax=Olea europaea var. sylvestris TaxID=158386 RepID=UPI000C1CDADA|nr:probable aspartyl protease At4g16563 [Olea europaea var. sylvestris]